MNDTKRLLIKISAIISIIEAISCIISGITFLADIGYFGMAQTGSGEAEAVFNLSKSVLIVAGVIVLVLGICAFVGGILLLNCVKNKKYYIPGAVLTIIGAGGLSIPAILLYISFAIKDSPFVFEQPQNPIPPVEQEKAKEDQLKKQMDILRQMRASGQITEQEFKELMMDLIKKY